MKEKILLGDSWPMTLIRRPVQIEPISIDNLRSWLALGGDFYSFWGHQNTIAAANRLLGVDVTPKTERPAVELTHEGLPTFEGEVFWWAYILNPDYRPGFRPQIGQEVGEEDITGWTCLRVTYPLRLVGGKLV